MLENFEKDINELLKALMKIKSYGVSNFIDNLKTIYGNNHSFFISMFGEQTFNQIEDIATKTSDIKRNIIKRKGE